jgi:hypothetical protein
MAKHLLSLPAVPRITWQEMPGWYGYVKGNYADSDHREMEIFLSADLPVGQVPETVLHEAKHLTQEVWHGPSNYFKGKAWRESQAEQFGRQWAHPVFCAGRRTGWDPHRVRIIEGHPGRTAQAALQPRRGDVVISKNGPKAWIYLNRNWTSA